VGSVGRLESFAGTYAGEFIQLTWKDKGFSAAVNNGERKLKQRIDVILQRYAPEIAGYMKLNAPWEDQTGNARNGLAAQAFNDGEGQGIMLFHQVPYGIFLEVKFSGRDAIILPTIEEYGPRVMASCEGLLER
jgi:hypothetical protein